MAERILGEEEVECRCSKALVALILCEEDFILLYILYESLVIIVDQLDI